MEKNTHVSKTLAPLYAPVLLSFLFSASPVISFFIAWLGSLFVFYQTWFSPAAFYNNDVPWHKQVMRPIFLLQLIFAGFMCTSSIFYFMDHLGYRYFSEINYGEVFQETQQTYLTAACQRYALVGHVALVTGILLTIKKEGIVIKYKQDTGNTYLIWLSIIVYILGSVSYRLPGLVQLAIPLMTVGIGCAAVLFSKGILTKHMPYLIIGSAVFFLNFVQASLSGYKEPIIINIIILAAVFFPYYKRTILMLSIPIGYFIFYFLPTYNAVVRLSWSGEITAEAAQEQAIETLIGNENSDAIDETNWGFLTNRFSEIHMFTQFVKHVPDKHDYYGWEIVENSLEVIIPRMFWKGKPNVEEVSMKRVYDAGVANPLSSVSAKTRPIVDAYLSWGLPGVYFFMLLYGWMVQYACNKSEELFGGYELGTVVIFNSLFQQMWRGNNFEFMFNNIFYAFLIMWALWWVLMTTKVINRVTE